MDAFPPFFLPLSYGPKSVLDSNLIFTLQLLNMHRPFFYGWSMKDAAAQVKRLAGSDPCPCQPQTSWMLTVQHSIPFSSRARHGSHPALYLDRVSQGVQKGEIQVAGQQHVGQSGYLCGQDRSSDAQGPSLYGGAHPRATRNIVLALRPPDLLRGSKRPFRTGRGVMCGLWKAPGENHVRGRPMKANKDGSRAGVCTLGDRYRSGDQAGSSARRSLSPGWAENVCWKHT